MKAGGQPLPDSTRSFLEPRFGQDLSHIRLHTDTRAAAVAEDVQADAFAVQNHIAFNQGQYHPETGEGMKLLAHEITHTIQQSGSGPLLQRQEKKDKKPQLSENAIRQKYADYRALVLAMRGVFRKGLWEKTLEKFGNEQGDLKKTLAKFRNKTNSLRGWLPASPSQKNLDNARKLIATMDKEMAPDVLRFLAETGLTGPQLAELSKGHLRSNDPFILFNDKAYKQKIFLPKKGDPVADSKKEKPGEVPDQKKKAYPIKFELRDFIRGFSPGPNSKLKLESGRFGVATVPKDNWNIRILNETRVKNGEYRVVIIPELKVLWNVRPADWKKQVDISSARDADISQANYEKVVSDLTPDSIGRPRRQCFWARDLTIEHEKQHARDYIEEYLAALQVEGEKIENNKVAVSSRNDVIKQVATLRVETNNRVFRKFERPVEVGGLPPVVKYRELNPYKLGKKLYQVRVDEIKKRGAKGEYKKFVLHPRKDVCP